MRYAGDALCFDDVLLRPGLSNVESRTQVDLSMQHGEFNLAFPFISAPMDAVTGFDMVLAMSEHGGIAVLPRFGVDQRHIFTQLRTGIHITKFFYSVGSGSGIDDLTEIEYLKSQGHIYICVDVAHGGNHKTMRKVSIIKDLFPEAVVMSGNVATLEEYKTLSNAGADLIRVGIGGGSACTTRIQTGHGVPTLQSVIDIAQLRQAGDAAIIADGGIRNSGDAAKAFAAGADYCMIGGALAGTSDAPKIVNNQGQQIFRGMASSNFTTNVEGVEHIIDTKGETKAVLRSFKTGLSSACSYSGVDKLSELAENAEYSVVTTSGVAENHAHHK